MQLGSGLQCHHGLWRVSDSSLPAAAARSRGYRWRIPSSSPTRGSLCVQSHDSVCGPRRRRLWSLCPAQARRDKPQAELHAPTLPPPTPHGHEHARGGSAIQPGPLNSATTNGGTPAWGQATIPCLCHAAHSVNECSLHAGAAARAHLEKRYAQPVSEHLQRVAWSASALLKGIWGRDRWVASAVPALLTRILPSSEGLFCCQAARSLRPGEHALLCSLPSSRR